MSNASTNVGAESVGIPSTSRVLTPTGWRRAEQLRPGDLVMQSDGASTIVVSTMMTGVLPVLEIAMQDGTRIASAPGHPVPVCVAGRDVVDLPAAHVGELLDRGTAVRISATQAVELNGTAPRPLDPYLLGVIIAEGALGGHSPIIWSIEPEIVARVEQLLPAGSRISPNPDVQDRCVGHRLISTQGRQKGGNPVLTALRELGLWGTRSETKFVPEGYLMAPIEERLALLRGLLDCDGGVDVSGKISYCSASPMLAHAVASVVRSLGGRCSEQVRGQVHYTRKGSPERHPARQSHVVNSIRLPGMVPLSLTRKADRVRPGARSWHWNVTGVQATAGAALMTIQTLRPALPILVNDFCPIYGTAEAILGAGQLVAA